jgi:hypothetical protein
MLRELYATPPPEFVAARNDLVKGLRRDKRRDDATALAALRRPGWDDWALNAVAGSDPEVVAGFAAAAADVREAQAAAIEGRDGPDIRTALKELRDHSAQLVRLAEGALGGAGRQPGAGEINTRLSQVATNDVAVAQLLSGILGSGDTAPKDLFGGLEPAAEPARRTTTKRLAKPTSSKGQAASGSESPGASATPAEPEVDAAAERAARAERERRQAVLADANREHGAAVKARRRVEAEVDRAAAGVDKARAALEQAEAALDAAQAELEAAVTATDAAAGRVEEARAALDA